MQPTGLPQHHFLLKIGSPIMLLRNLDPPNMCHWTRLTIKNVYTHIIEATILSGCCKREDVFIPRIPLIPSNLPFNLGDYSSLSHLPLQWPSTNHKDRPSKWYHQYLKITSCQKPKSPKIISQIKKKKREKRIIQDLISDDGHGLTINRISDHRVNMCHIVMWEIKFNGSDVLVDSMK